MPLDPFTQIHDAIWTMLEAHAAFVAMVPAGNRIKFGGTGAKRDPMKEQVQGADLPEVRVVFASIDPDGYTSNSEILWVRWEIQVATGDQRLTESLLPLTFEVFRAMHGWRTVLGGLTWGGTNLVISSRTDGIKIGVADADLNRNIKGWSAVWAAKMRIAFALTAIQPVP